MVRAKWLRVAIAICLMLVGCNGPVKKDLTCELSLEGSQPSKSDSITIAIHIDGTPSMQGYVTNNTKTRYAKTLDLLDSTFLLGGSQQAKSNVEYYRLGTSSQKITRDDYLKGKEPEFYDGSVTNFPLLEVSQIETAITSAKDNKLSATPTKDDRLTVIVTDLYQKAGDVTNVNDKIKETYLNNKGAAVGILAIRSEFNGTVYIEDTKGINFEYATVKKQANHFRPFYIIFLGNYTDISYYFEKLKSGGGELLKDSKIVIFYPTNLVGELSFLQGSPELPTGMNRLMSVNDGNVTVELNNQAIELFEIEKNETKDFDIRYSVPFAPLSHTLPIDPNSIETVTNIEAFDTVDKEFKKPPDDSLKKAIELSEWKIADNNTLNFVTKIKPSDIQESGVYFFKVDVVAKGLQEQSWWQEKGDWDSSENSTDGSKTHNLFNFLQGLKTTTTGLLRNNPHPIGRFCYAIQKN